MGSQDRRDWARARRTARVFAPSDGLQNEEKMTKRELIRSILDPGRPQQRIPAAFFMHFDPAFHEGRAAVEKHLEFFRFTDMDFVKIQYERKFPRMEIANPEDWSRVPRLDRSFFAPLLEAVAGLVEEASAEACVVMTLYSPFMCAGHIGGRETLVQHIREDPAAVNAGLEIVTQSLMVFVQECIRLGVDGFYHSTQGGEAGLLPEPILFDAVVRPWDLLLMEEIARRCEFNILHVCDYHGPYDDITRFVSYPGHIVNVNPHVGGSEIEMEEISRMFDRPFFGGLDRKGVLATGTEAEIRQEVRNVLARKPTRFLLGADCTLPPGTPWENLRIAIEEAHAWRPD